MWVKISVTGSYETGILIVVPVGERIAKVASLKVEVTVVLMVIWDVVRTGFSIHVNILPIAVM